MWRCTALAVWSSYIHTSERLARQSLVACLLGIWKIYIFEAHVLTGSNIWNVSGLPVPYFGQHFICTHAWCSWRSAYSLVQCLRFYKRWTTFHELHPWLHRYTWLYILFPYWPNKTSQFPWASRTRILWYWWRITKL